MLALFGIISAERGTGVHSAGPFETTGGDDERFEERRLADAVSTDQGDGSGLWVAGG